MTEEKQKTNYINEIEKDLEDEGMPSNKNLIYAIALITICGFSVMVVMQNNGANQTITAAQLEGENLVLDRTKISTKAKFFYYEVDNVRVQFFAVEGFDGNVHVALDACDVCFAGKQGYSQRDTIMVCNNCGNEFQINGIGTENLSGGCWPSYISFSIAGDKIYVPEYDIVQKRYMFA
jgi:uncharacterized membrane protein